MLIKRLGLDLIGLENQGFQPISNKEINYYENSNDYSFNNFINKPLRSTIFPC